MACESSTRDTGYGAGFCLVLSYFLLVDRGCCFGPVVVIDDDVGSQVKKSLSVMLAGAGRLVKLSVIPEIGSKLLWMATTQVTFRYLCMRARCCECWCCHYTILLCLPSVESYV
jgi:hypothetical protein